MLRNLRHNPGKDRDGEEVENIPVNLSDSLNPRIGVDPSRPALSVIQEPHQVSKCISGQELGKANRVDRTPPKPKSKYSDAPGQLRTPEKQGIMSKNRYGWTQKNEHQPSNCVVEMKEEGKVLANTYTPRPIRGAGRSTSSYSEPNSTQNTPTKSVSKPPYPGFIAASGSRPPFNGGNRFINFNALSKGTPSSSSTSTVVNTVEVPYFELKEDISFWMEHNVQVLVRVRPLNTMEKSSFGFSRCLKQETSNCITWIGVPETQFTFDHVACETIDQETLFRMVGLPMVENCLSGYNSCMFAYGQTGSGKTFTMLGEIDKLEIKPRPNRGMTPRIFEFLFARIKEEEECRRDERLKYSCKCSFLEIYNEQITDLLDPSSANLTLREDKKKGVFVENLSEFEVHTVEDILHLLSEGSSNRKVASTNMNLESSRSHSVFTCVIESSWEKDSTTNFRFSRLNLVDLAGSERQKSSGAEGERLKEAANINKSLSTLGHVIMALVDVANGKLKHVPYRDSRLTFLLQDSLGGNSKTMIIANVSPSICSAAETLNTLMFAQRAKRIKNNAVINEDSSGDVIALQFQIQKLKEELSALKHEKVTRSLSFGHAIHRDLNTQDEDGWNSGKNQLVSLFKKEPDGILRVSCKQLKSLETTLAGALRREQMGESSIKQLEAEIEHLNRLVSQREEDTRCTKMMLKFREDKILRMESLLGGLISTDDYLQKENTDLSEEIQLLRERVDKNPQVTRFALENIRLLDQVRRFQDLYEEGEREMLMTEVSELRNQLVLFLDENSKNLHYPDMKYSGDGNANDLIQEEFKRTLSELEESKANLTSCLDQNAKLKRELEQLRTSVINQREDEDTCVKLIKQAEKIVHLQLELDIQKIIVQEERSYHAETEEKAQSLNRDLQLSKETSVSATKEYYDVLEKLKTAELVIEALESQQIMSINEIEDLKHEIYSLKDQAPLEESRNLTSHKHLESRDSPLEAKLRKMHESLEKAKRLNQWYQNGFSEKASDEEEMEEVRKQVETETAEVIVCLQEELSVLQEKVNDSKKKEMETQNNLMLLQTQMEVLENDLNQRIEENARLAEMLQVREMAFLEEWEVAAGEIEQLLCGGHVALNDAADQIDLINISNPHKHSRISEQFERVRENISEKELAAEKLKQCLHDATDKINDLESKLRPLRGAVIVLTETHQLECNEKEKQILDLSSKLKDLTCTVTELEISLEHEKGCRITSSSCATAALVLVNRLSELTSDYQNALTIKNEQLKEFQEIITERDAVLCTQSRTIDEAHERCHSFQMERDASDTCCNELRLQLSKELNDLACKVSELEILLGNEKGRRITASSCATAALVIVNRLSELKSGYHNALIGKNEQVREFQDIITERDAVLRNQARIIDEAHERCHSLQRERDASDNCCKELRLQLSEEQSNLEALRVKLEETVENDILEAREKLNELNSGVSTLKLCMNGYWMANGDLQQGTSSLESVCSSSTNKCESLVVNQTKQDFEHTGLCHLKDITTKTSKCCTEVGTMKQFSVDKNLVSEGMYNRDTTIILLKKEIESALNSLQQVQAEMSKLYSEKVETLASERHSQKSIASFMNQALLLQNVLNDFEAGIKVKVNALDGKLGKMEEFVHKSCTAWYQERQLLEAELDRAKVLASQKTIEASCVLEKFEEVQDTMKEADIMINELMIANETLKLNAHDLRVRESDLTNQKNVLVDEVQTLKSSNNLKDEHYRKLEKQFSELEDMMLQAHTTSVENWSSLSSDFLSIKSEFQKSSELIRCFFEEIWSEIIVKDCAVSVSHICHMGILLKMANGLNAENGLLHHSLCKSNSIISELREKNSKSRGELEMHRVLEGKLADIKKGFDRVSQKVDEAGELQLTLFEKKIQDLQFQEEMMLQRSNNMGFELSMLMKELDFSNAFIMDQQRLLREKDELLELREDDFLEEISAKELESVFLSSELHQMSDTCVGFLEVLENSKKDLIFKSIFASSCELILLDKENEFAVMEEKVDANEALVEENRVLSCRVQNLNCQYEQLLEDVKLKEIYIGNSYRRIFELNRVIESLQDHVCMQETESHIFKINLVSKNEELGRLESTVKENKMLQNQLHEHKEDYIVVEVENHKLRNDILILENLIGKLKEDLHQARVEMQSYEQSQSVESDLNLRIKELEIQLEDVSVVKKENVCLRNELNGNKISELEYLNALMLKSLNIVDLVKNVDSTSSKILNHFTENFIEMDNMFQETVNGVEKMHTILEQFCDLENRETLSAQIEVSRKDDIIKGLLFDLSLLQESTSKSKDQKDEIEEIVSSFQALEKDFELKSFELEKAVTKGQILESQLQEARTTISSLESEITKRHQIVCSLSKENSQLLASAKDTLEAKSSVEKELINMGMKCKNLEMEIAEMEKVLAQMSDTMESLKNNLDTLTTQKNYLDDKVHTMTEDLDKARTLAEENEAIALEAQEIAESRQMQAEEREEEVKLLERSVEELECTVNVLENKVDIVKGEAEKQRLEREELELELHAAKEQMQNVKNNYSDIKRDLNEKEKNLQETLHRVQQLESDIAGKDAELSQCRDHICELNFHAEAQACEYKEKYKSLEAMVEQVKSEVPAIHCTSSSPCKLERKSSKPRGSGSPFKCIGLGLGQQIKSEKDEELNAGRQRIEELEALASSRQKEIFMLKARLASTESMTHDVLRDLVTVKQNMKDYASLVDNQKLHSLMDESQYHSIETVVKEQEVIKLKLQINEYIKEKNRWLEEIERKQAEVMAAHVALEKLRQENKFHMAENGMSKMENVNHKKRIMVLESEVKKLSGQQNIQQRIHHHAKIKEENNSLRSENEGLNNKLLKAEAILKRAKEELAQFRAANGRNPHINFDQEQMLDQKLKETEEERLQLAQKLFHLCTSVVQVSGITRPTSEINLFTAEDALDKLNKRVISLEHEIQDVKLKNRIYEERTRLSEIMPQTSSGDPLSCE